MSFSLSYLIVFSSYFALGCSEARPRRTGCCKGVGQAHARPRPHHRSRPERVPFYEDGFDAAVCRVERSRTSSLRLSRYRKSSNKPPSPIRPPEAYWRMYGNLPEPLPVTCCLWSIQCKSANILYKFRAARESCAHHGAKGLHQASEPILEGDSFRVQRPLQGQF